MKLYFYPGACSLIVRIVLNELNRVFEDEAVDLRVKKTTTGENFLAINPKGAVPALRLEDGVILTEVQVILQYLADSMANQTLLAKVGDLKRYQTLEWLNYISTELHKSLGLFYNPSLSEDVKTNLFIPLIAARFAFLNERLSESSYLMGEALTLPDAYLYVMIRWAHFFKIDLTRFTAINQFFERMNDRASVKISLKQEQF